MTGTRCKHPSVFNHIREFSRNAVCPFTYFTEMLIRDLSHPALLLTTVMSFTPVFNRPLIKFSGIPHKPKPETEKGEIKHTHRDIAWGHIMFYLQQRISVQEIPLRCMNNVSDSTAS